MDIKRVINGLACFPFIIGGMTLGGCSGTFTPAAPVKMSLTQPGPFTAPLPAMPKPQSLTAASSPPPAREGIAACRAELAALERINPRAFATQQTEFNKLLRKAAQYAAVREEVNLKTKETMDSLYKYKTTQVCQAISWALMTSLIKKGEGL